MSAVDGSTAQTTFDYDLHDWSLAENPFPLWNAFRSLHTVPWSEGNGGFWVASTYEQVQEVSLDPPTFSSTKGAAIPQLPWPQMPPIDYDEPEHKKFRRVLNPLFSPQAARDAQSAIRNICKDLLATFEGRDEFDFGVEYAAQVPLRYTFDMFKIGYEHRDNIEEWVAVVTRQRDDVDKAGPAAQQLLGFLGTLIAERRANPIDNDLLSTMITADVDGRKMDDQELVLMSVLLLIAGLDTTSMAISVSAWFFANNPDKRQTWIDHPEIRASATEELLRWISPVPFEGRTVTHDTEFHGCPMRQGDTVAFLLGSANRDVAEFEDPDEVIFDRFPNRHVTFGVGIHRCLGSNLARHLVRIALEEFLDAYPDYFITDPGRMQWTTREVRGLTKLPLGPRSVV